MNDLKKPFVQWVGGKTRLIDTLLQELPNEIDTYIEPFVGGGALLFALLSSKNKRLKKVVINDINRDLIDTYNEVRDRPIPLMDILDKYQSEYHALKSDDIKRKEYYVAMRDKFNTRSENRLTHSALFLFLNKTSFNALYRVNKSNKFNVAIGTNKEPILYYRDNILSVSKALKDIEILNTDFKNTLDYSDGSTVFYLDPPYTPVSTTSNFTSYTKNGFNDSKTMELINFCNTIDKMGHKFMLSNSSDIFNNKYNVLNVRVGRTLNSDVNKRGKVKEVIIKNFN